MESVIAPGSTSSRPGEHAPGPVLFLLSSLNIGGSERKTVRVANGLFAKGFDIHVAYLDPAHTLRGSLDSRIPTICFQRSGKISVWAIGALRAYIKKYGIRRIVCVNLYPLLYAQAVRFLLPSRHCPTVYLMTNTTYHASLRAERLMAIYRPLMRRTSRIIFGNRLQLDLWADRYRLDRSRCEVIYNGVDTVRFDPKETHAAAMALRQSLGFGKREFVIGTVGQLRPEKNQAELLSALAGIREQVPDTHLVIAGTGPSRLALESAVVAAGLTGAVTFLGEVDDVRPVLQLMDVFVLPSISETFSNAALEAMAMETAVILTDVGGAREMVTNGVNGLLYSQGDVDQLATLLMGLAADALARSRLGRAGRRTVLEHFSEDRMIAEYEQRVIS